MNNNIVPHIEAWRLVDGWDNYEVSSHGRIRNNRTKAIMAPNDNGCGYYKIALSDNGFKRTIKIHTLVAKAFCDNPHNYDVVDHIDRNPHNNHYQNLRYCTQSQNLRNQKKKSNNTSGVTGVVFSQKQNSWNANIVNNNNKRISKSFNCGKYADAKQRAVQWRRQKEQEFGYTNE